MLMNAVMSLACRPLAFAYLPRFVVAVVQEVDSLTLRLMWPSPTTELVSWSLTSPFSTNIAISEKKGQGW